MDRLSRANILAAFNALSDVLQQEARCAEITIMGGAAMVLVHDAREATKDVDAASSLPSMSDLRASIVKVGERLGLPHDWINDAAKGYVQGLAAGPTVFSSHALIV